jgi:Fic family protein
VSRVIRRRWSTDFTAPTRAGNRSCEYEAYVPDPLVGRDIVLSGEVAADVADAEVAIARLNVVATGLVDTEALARILLRAESVASSKIEGLEVGARRLLRAEAARGLGEAPTDITAFEVLGNIDAMVACVATADKGEPVTLEMLLDLHRRLLAGSRLAAHGGRLREVQNWIGGSDYNPCSAAFVPAPPALVHDLMVDLVTFVNSNSLPAVAQAAMAHAQFETIHPFIDGNGRTGRALIHLILRRRGLAPRVLPPVSLILATWAKDYIGGLEASRYQGTSTSSAAQKGANLWIGRFAGACRRAVTDATKFEERAQGIEATWRQRLEKVRTHSATDLLLRVLVGAPVVTVNSAAELIDRSFAQTNQAIARLVEAEILRQVTVGRRNRAFEAADVIDAFTDLERQLASPVGDTRISEPVRQVPRRRQQ